MDFIIIFSLLSNIVLLSDILNVDCHFKAERKQAIYRLQLVGHGARDVILKQC